MRGDGGRGRGRLEEKGGMGEVRVRKREHDNLISGS